MKQITFLLLFYSVIGFSQTKDLCDLVFSRKDNFDIIKTFNGIIPDDFKIIDTTAAWNPKTFYLDDLNLNSNDVLAEIEKDDHHPYHHTYLFSDKLLDNKVSVTEKIRLSKIAQNTKSNRIELKGENYATIKEVELTKGFYFLITEPIYSENGKFAFLKVIIKDKFNFLGKEMNQYFGRITIMFEKNEMEKWNQTGIKKFLML
jgi:hypothetical protein